MNKDKRNNIQLLGTLNNADESGIIANANQIYDDVQQKAQETINSELIEAVDTGGSVDTRITNAVNVEKTRAEGAESTLDGKITAEQTRAANAENALDGRVDTLEEAVGTGGSVDSRIASAVATETSRAQEAEANRYTKNETYTKEEVNNLITTPNQEYVSVTAIKQTIVVTDLLPAPGAADTIYRVGNWDGSKYDTTCYTEYAWNGSIYVPLNTKEYGIDDEPTAGSDNLVKSGGVQEELALGAVYDVSAKNPTAGPNNDGKFESLSALLSDANLNTLIPTVVRKGGMSIKFVQSSDDKYVQYRLMPEEFSTNTEDWAIADEGTYVENPEFIYVKTDAKGKILWGIKIDGGIYYGIGIPQQVIDYIEQKIADLSLDEYEDIVAFLNGLTEGDKTLQTLLNEKVDKEEDKSLINSEYAEGVHYIESPEFTEIKVDSEQRILEATYKDGTKLFPAGVETPKVNLKGTAIENKANPEYIEAKVGVENKLLEGTKSDGTKVIGGNLEVSKDLNVKGDVEINGNVSYKNGIPQAIIDYVAANTGSGVTNIEYEDETGDMYATFDDADGVTDVYMDENGDIYAEIEE